MGFHKIVRKPLMSHIEKICMFKDGNLRKFKLYGAYSAIGFALVFLMQVVTFILVKLYFQIP